MKSAQKGTKSTPPLGPIGQERGFTTAELANGRASLPQNLPLRISRMRAEGWPVPKSYGKIPSDELRRKWSNPFIPTGRIIEDVQDISSAIGESRNRDMGNRLISHASINGHVEAVDFTDIRNLQDNFFYLSSPSALTERRLSMLADLTAHAIKFKLKEKAKRRDFSNVTVVDFGPGPYPLERMLNQLLTPKERSHVSLIAVDVSEDLLSYGLSKGYVDRAIAEDMSKIKPDELSKMLPAADVVIYAEILEHIDHSVLAFKNQMLPLIKQNHAFFIGSVPNAVQLAELPYVYAGLGSPHQLRRPIFDRTNDHHSFYDIHSLNEALGEVWKFKNYGIVSNGVRLQKDGDEADILAGLDIPQGGDRLIFWAQN